MPLPTPNSGESRDDFLDRCMADSTMNSEYPDADQRYAVCSSQWGKEDKGVIKKRIVVGHVAAVHEEKQIGENGNEVPVGIVEGYLATWDIDRANDRFVKGAFADTIADLQGKKRPLRLKRNHWNLIGGFDPEKMYEDDKGLYGVAELNLLVAEAREAYALAKQGVLSDFSVGFSAELENIDIIEGVRVFKKARLWETSLVDEPMNERAQVVGVRSIDEIQTREEIIRAVAQYRQQHELVHDEEVEKQINERFEELVGHKSPLERGCWAWSELRALPKSLRGYIIAHERLSRDAIDSIVDAVAPTRKERSTEGQVEGLLRMLDGEKQTNEDTIAEVRGLLAAKREAIDTMRDIIGRDDFNEDAAAELVGLLDADSERNDTIRDVLGRPSDEESGMDEDEEKAIGEIADILKGAFNG